MSEKIEYDLKRYRIAIFRAINKRLKYNTPIITRPTITKQQLDKIADRCDLFERGETDQLI